MLAYLMAQALARLFRKAYDMSISCFQNISISSRKEHMKTIYSLCEKI